jgi:hypothetical protein
MISKKCKSKYSRNSYPQCITYEKLQSFMLAIRPLEKNDKTYEKWDKSI